MDPTGAEVDLECPGFYKNIARLLQTPGVRKIVPVGSKGVGYEIRNLADLHRLDVEFHETKIDLCKSAGPVSCIVVLCAESAVVDVLGVGGVVVGYMN